MFVACVAKKKVTFQIIKTAVAPYFARLNNKFVDVPELLARLTVHRIATLLFHKTVEFCGMFADCINKKPVNYSAEENGFSNVL